MRLKSLIIAAALVLPLTVFAQSATPPAVPTPGILPDSPWYFLDRIGEYFQELFTFQPAAKARLELKFAGERLAEIKVLIDQKGAQAKGLDVAEGRLKDSLAKAADIVASEKTKGQDVTDLAKELRDSIDAEDSALHDIYKPQADALGAQIKDLQQKIAAALLAGDNALADQLRSQLAALRAQSDALDHEVSDQSAPLEDAANKLKDQMDLKSQAEESVKEAEDARQELTSEASDKGVVLTQDMLGPVDTLLANAKKELDAGNYQAAIELAKNADKAVEQAKEKLDQETGVGDNEEKTGESGDSNEKQEGETGSERSSGDNTERYNAVNGPSDQPVNAPQKD